MDDVKQFCELLLKDMGIWDTLEPAVRDQMVEDYSERLIGRIQRAIIDAMTDEQAQRLGELMDAGQSPEALDAFVASCVPFEQQKAITIRELNAFRALYIKE